MFLSEMEWILLLVFIVTVEGPILFLLSGTEHKHSGMFFIIISLGSLHAVFCYLSLVDSAWYLNENDINSSLIRTDWFPLMCFALSFAIVFESMVLESKFSKVYFGVSLAFLYMILVGEGKQYFQFLLSSNNLKHKHDLQTIPAIQYLEIADRSQHNGLNITILSEYVLVYIPVSLIFFKKINGSEFTFKEWWDLPSKEKCEGCRFFSSLGRCIVIFIFVVTWCIRPLNCIFQWHFNQKYMKSFEVTPAASLLSMYISLLIIIIKYYTVGVGTVHEKCDNNSKRKFEIISEDFQNV